MLNPARLIADAQIVPGWAVYVIRYIYLEGDIPEAVLPVGIVPEGHPAGCGALCTRCELEGPCSGAMCGHCNDIGPCEGGGRWRIVQRGDGPEPLGGRGPILDLDGVGVLRTSCHLQGQGFHDSKDCVTFVPGSEVVSDTHFHAERKGGTH